MTLPQDERRATTEQPAQDALKGATQGTKSSASATPLDDSPSTEAKAEPLTEPPAAPSTDAPHQAPPPQADPKPLQTSPVMDATADSIASSTLDPAPAEVADAPVSTNDKQWYVIHVLSGSESKIAEAIESRIDQAGLSDQVASITVPSETVTEIRRGRRINTQRKFFPGYILVEMAMSDHAWQVIKNTPKVTGFLGTREEPTPISAQEAQRILNQVKEGIARPKPLISYEIGEQVKVCDGPFESFIGLVEDVDNERERVKVAVSIFGRATPVELEFSQVQKA